MGGRDLGCDGRPRHRTARYEKPRQWSAQGGGHRPRRARSTTPPTSRSTTGRSTSSWRSSQRVRGLPTPASSGTGSSCSRCGSTKEADPSRHEGLGDGRPRPGCVGSSLRTSWHGGWCRHHALGTPGGASVRPVGAKARAWSIASSGPIARPVVGSPTPAQRGTLPDECACHWTTAGAHGSSSCTQHGSVGSR